jgi:hypothetical protein
MITALFAQYWFARLHLLANRQLTGLVTEPRRFCELAGHALSCQNQAQPVMAQPILPAPQIQISVRAQGSMLLPPQQCHPPFSARLLQYPDMTTRALACWLLGQQLALTEQRYAELRTRELHVQYDNQVDFFQDCLTPISVMQISPPWHRLH